MDSTRECIRIGKLDIGNLILLFMVAVYPLLILPDPMPYLLSLDSSVYPNYTLGGRYIALAILSITSLIFIIKKNNLVYDRIYIPLFLFIALASISSFFAPFPFIAWIGLPTRFTGLFTYYFCVVLFFLAIRSDSVPVLLKYMLYSAAAVSFLGLLQYFGINLIPHNRVIGEIVRSTMGHHNILGTYTAFMLTAAVLKYINSKSISWLVLAGLIYSGLLVSFCRGAWIGFLFGFIFIGIYCWKNSEHKQLYAKIIILFVLITVLLAPMRNGSLMNRFKSITGDNGIGTTETSASYRVFIWRKTSKVFLDNWLFGIGPDHLYYENIIMPDSAPVDKAHNIFLEIAVTMGIFTLVAYLLFLGCFFKRTNINTPNLFIFKTMILVYLVQGLFSVDVLMVMPIFWIVLGLSIASQKVEQKLLPS